MRIGIIGAGAIGGWLGVRLAAAGLEVSVLARGETLSALSQSPWRLKDSSGTLEAKVEASDDPAKLGRQDLLILAVKGPALAAVLPAIRAMCDPDTIVLPAMNGVPWWFLLDSAEPALARPLESIDPFGALQQAIPLSQVLGAVVYTSAVIDAPGSVRIVTGNKLILGEPGGAMTERVIALAKLLQDAGIDAVPSERIRYELWYKLWGNMTVNPISAITGSTSDRIIDDELANRFILSVMSEAQRIGERIGLVIEERGEDRNVVTRSWGAFKTSMLQDAEAGRPMEIDALIGAPREIAQRLGLETPALDALLGLTRLFARQKGLYPDAPLTASDAA
jgi:2-dehydropantoate 2-reductase